MFQWHAILKCLYLASMAIKSHDQSSFGMPRASMFIHSASALPDSFLILHNSLIFSKWLNIGTLFWATVYDRLYLHTVMIHLVCLYGILYSTFFFFQPLYSTMFSLFLLLSQYNYQVYFYAIPLHSVDSLCLLILFHNILQPSKLLTHPFLNFVYKSWCLCNVPQLVLLR